MVCRSKFAQMKKMKTLSKYLNDVLAPVAVRKLATSLLLRE